MIIWGSLEWFNPFVDHIYNPTDKEKAAVIQNHFNDTGVYIWPSPYTPHQFSSNKDAVFFLIKQQGSFYNPEKFITTQFFIWAVFWWVLVYLITRYAISTIPDQLRFVLTMVALCQFVYLLPMWNWWGLPTEYVLYSFVNLVLGTSIALLFVSTIFLKKHFTTHTTTN